MASEIISLKVGNHQLTLRTNQIASLVNNRLAKDTAIALAAMAISTFALLSLIASLSTGYIWIPVTLWLKDHLLTFALINGGSCLASHIGVTYLFDRHIQPWAESILRS